MKYSICNVTGTDLDAVLAINQSVVPHVNSLEMADMQSFLAKAAYFRIALDEEKQVLAFLIGLDPDTEYDSLNYRWFCAHYESFAYVDRVAVAASARRQGIAEALYGDFTTAALGWAQRLGCEVNLLPSNPGSLAFHSRLGFTRVGTQDTHKGTKRVAFLLKDIRG